MSLLNQYSFREATQPDIPAMQAIERDALTLFESQAEYASIAQLENRNLAEHLDVQQRGTALVAEHVSAEIAGFILLLPVDGHGHVLELNIARNHQAQGLGSALLEQADIWARTSEFQSLSLTCYQDIPWQYPAYERRGYKPVEVRHDQVELLAIIKEEAEAGYAAWPRLAMRKTL